VKRQNPSSDGRYSREIPAPENREITLIYLPVIEHIFFPGK
jgi:hypothetical protein